MFLTKSEVLNLKKGEKVEVFYKFNRPGYQEYLDKMVDKGLISQSVCPKEYEVFAEVIKNENNLLTLKINKNSNKYEHQLFSTDGSAGVDSIFHFKLKKA